MLVLTKRVMAVFKGLADDSIHNIDTAIYDAIPESAHPISDPITRD